EPVGARGAVPKDGDDVPVSELAEGFHLGAELPEPLEGVAAEFFYGDGEAVGETSLVDEPEASVADDEVRREVPGRLDELRHRDLAKRGVKRGALADGDGGEVGIVDGSGPRPSLIVLTVFASAGVDDGKE
ncbi:hypothetical protein U1Q18_042138, partial [Sarracenia purpurea var. burkii]